MVFCDMNSRHLSLEVLQNQKVTPGCLEVYSCQAFWLKRSPELQFWRSFYTPLNTELLNPKPSWAMLFLFGPL